MRGGAGVLRSLIAAATMAMIIAAVAPSTSGTELAGSQGTDTSLPATESAMTLSGRSQFSGLKITVNQTGNLVNQAVSITWTGGRPTVSDRQPFASNFMQVMQCWGADDGTVASNPGPSPEQCVFGATNARYGAADPYTWGNTSSRALSNRNWPGYDPGQGVVDPVSGSGQVWKPFRGVAGDATNVPLNQNFDPNVAGGAYWLNPDFDAVTTNEIAGARTGLDGKGAELFQVNTGAESSGLGCGQKVQPVAGGSPTIPKCWLVVVPRGTGAEEDVGADIGAAGPDDVVTSPLSANAWKNRIAFPLTFNPLDSPCALAADQRQVSGNELAATAIASWQPALCTSGAHGPYAYSVVPDASARLQLQSNIPGGAGMIVVNKPFDPSAFTSANPVVYAPLTLSATVIGFNVERNAGSNTDPAVTALGGVRFADINLTPRLLAKLLTQSYSLQVAVQGPPPKNYTWATGNPPQMGADQDFLQFNPEFTEYLVNQGKDFGGLVLPLGNSDQAEQVWRYVLADPEAKAWLDGKADPWGMRVNPAYATVASVNSTGAAFANPAPNAFPKSDPYCYQAPPLSATVTPPPICGNGWYPYATSLHLAAKETRVAADGAKIVENVVAQSADQVWGVDVPQRLGYQAIMSVTDSPSAALFGIQAARLSRAGDDGSARQFVAPNSPAMTAAVATMKAQTVAGVLQPDPSATAPNAYPLTTLTYAASAPLQLDNKSRQDLAYLLDYAAGPGQVPGLQLGQLPTGYAPLSDALRKQTSAAAQRMRTLTAPSTASSVPRASTPSGGSRQAGTAPSVTSASPSPSGTAVGAPSVVSPASPLPVQSAPPARSSPAVFLTPALRAAALRYFVPGLIAVTLLSALGALEITKRPRFGLRTARGEQGGDGDLSSVDRPTEGVQP